MSRTTIILCLVVASGLVELVAGFAAPTYQWEPQMAFVRQDRPPVPLAFSEEAPVVVLVNQANPVDDLSLRQLARIYAGEVTEWPNGESIVPINRPIHSEIRRRFYQIVLHAPPTTRFFQTGSPIPFETVRVDSETAIPRFVARDRGAIAYCFQPCGVDAVKVLKIDGRMPQENGYALK